MDSNKEPKLRPVFIALIAVQFSDASAIALQSALKTLTCSDVLYGTVTIAQL